MKSFLNYVTATLRALFAWRGSYSKDLNAWNILMNFFFFEVKKGGGALVHVYVSEHIVSLNYRIVWWIFTKLGRDKIPMTLHICIDSCAKSAQGWIQGGAKIGPGGFPSPKNFFRPEGYSNKPNA